MLRSFARKLRWLSRSESRKLRLREEPTVPKGGADASPDGLSEPVETCGQFLGSKIYQCPQVGFETEAAAA